MNNHPEIPTFATKKDFGAWATKFRESDGWREPIAFALGSPIYTKSGTLASVRFPVVNGPAKNLGTASVYMHYFGIKPEGVRPGYLADYRGTVGHQKILLSIS